MKTLKKHLMEIYVHLLRMVYGIDRNKVVFVSFSGKSYSDNPKCISEALHEQMPEAKIFWLFTDPETKKSKVPDYVQCVEAGNNRTLYKHLATARVIVSNFSLYMLPKSKKQMFIQTWHGDKAFKKVLFDSPFISKDFFVPEQRPGYCDLAVAGSKYGKRQFESAFRYTGKILMEGTPRNDRLVRNDPNLCQELKQKVGVQKDIKCFLYAPTLRRECRKTNEKQHIQDLDISATLDLLEKKDGCKWMCLLRAHPAMVGLTGTGEDDRILDVSSYEDMADLLLVSDMLITDYSSCAGDFAVLKRPVVLYHADRQEYLKKDRTFYFEMEDSPYWIAENQQQLESILANISQETAAENCQQILDFYGDCETGHASQSVAKIIKDWLKR